MTLDSCLLPHDACPVQRARIVYNPAARNAPSFLRLSDAARALVSEGWHVDIASTRRAGEGVEIARDAAAHGIEVVFSCGGDGTINEVVNGLAGSGTALAVIRGGMGDVFGKEAGVPRDPVKALHVLLDGERHRMDLGLANQRHFLLMAGIGFDAAVVDAVPSGPKRLLGSTSYALWAVRELVRYRPRDVDLLIDGSPRSSRLYWLLLGNTRSYGGIASITGSALADDGLLDAYVFEGSSPAWLAATAARLAAGRQDGGRGVAFQRLQSLEVLTPGLPVQADGEYIGETPMRFGVAPAALDVLLPPGKARRLFGP